MKNKTVTVVNCRHKTNELIASFPKEDINANQCAAWRIVLQFCEENGMRKNTPLSGIESVIKFIDKKIQMSKKK